MSNLPIIPESAPDYLRALTQSNPDLATVNDAAIASIGGGFPPYIGIKNGRFVVKDGDIETVLPQLEIDVLVLRGKDTFSKKYYATAYKPGQETQAPDCMSSDGITPDVGVKAKQCDSCAGCAHNQFGTAVRQDGTLGGGKACADVKTLAIYANKGIYGFNVPPDSLKNFRTYVSELSKRNIPLPTVITRISFDTTSDTTKLLFNFAGFMPQDKVGAVIDLTKDTKVLDIINPKATMKVQHTSTQEAKQIPSTPPAAAPAATKPAPAPRTAKPKPVPAPAQPVASEGFGDLSLALGGGGNDVTDEELNAALDLGL